MITFNGQEITALCWIIPIILLVIGFKNEFKELFVGLWKWMIKNETLYVIFRVLIFVPELIWNWIRDKQVLQQISYCLSYIPTNMIRMLSKGYISKNVFFVSSMPKFINSFRMSFGILPIWIIPGYDFVQYSEVELLHRATPLYYEAKRAITRSGLDEEARQKLLSQCFLAVQNIADSLWQLFNLRTIMGITGNISIRKKFDDEVQQLEQKILLEMSALVEKLLSISLSLLKSEVVQDDHTIQGILSDISQNNSRLEKIIAPENAKYNKVSKNTTAYYLLLFLSLAATFTIISLYTSSYALPIIIIGSLVVFIAISIVQFRKDNTIKDESFVKVIIEILKSIRLMK